jgi:hypothetical protein
MPNESMTQSNRPDQAASGPIGGEHRIHGAIPVQEREQPDPMLQITTGRTGAGGITLLACAVAFILAIVFYGLNSRGGAEHMAAAPPAPPAAQSSSPPAAGKGGAEAQSAPRANGVKG